MPRDNRGGFYMSRDFRIRLGADEGFYMSRNNRIG